MQEKTLLKISLVSSLAGLFILLLVADSVELNQQTVERIDNLGEDVKFIGKVIRVANHDSVMFIDLQTVESTTIVAFKDRNLTISPEDQIEVIGKVDEYNGEPELIAHRIRKLR